MYLDPEESNHPHVNFNFIFVDFAPADLIILDECAAIPLTTVKSILQCKAMAMLSSTVYGYEGTGRALSLKLLEVLGILIISDAC